MPPCSGKTSRSVWKLENASCREMYGFAMARYPVRMRRSECAGTGLNYASGLEREKDVDAERRPVVLARPAKSSV